MKKLIGLGSTTVTPDEAAPLYVYLASGEPRYVTAQVLSIDGGVYN
jgi:hypothetical protein